MPGPTPDLSDAGLAEHAEFLCALARSLVRDEHRAEDLAQDALVAGVLRRPPEAVDLRSWSARVLRNLSITAHRAAVRRAYHERAATGCADAPSQESVRDRLEVQRMLAEAVEELREPQRTTIYLRFYEGLPPRAIAVRMGVLVSTVKTRLQRGLELLRARLDATSGGDRSAWCAALVALGASRPSAPPVAAAAGSAFTGAILMKTKWILVAAVALSTLAWVQVRMQSDDESPLAAVAPEDGAPTRAAVQEPVGLTPSHASPITTSDRAPAKPSKDGPPSPG
ncbi:MAG: sigma-70 family RNA polymerase sigma factor [bacterium]|nr:sigma-70 family RNA polymerase sigma factor [bacterium]